MIFYLSALNYYAWSLSQYQSLNLLRSLGSIQLCAAVLSATVAIKHNIHLYPWSLGQYQTLNCLSSLDPGEYTALCCRTQCYSGYQTQYPSAPLVIGPISILKPSQLHREYTALCCRTQCYSGYQTQYPAVPLVIGPISNLKLSQLSGEYTALCCHIQWLSNTISISTHRYPLVMGAEKQIYTIKCLAQAHQWNGHGRDSNPHPDMFLSPDFERRN